MTLAMSFFSPQTAYVDVCDDTAYAFRAKSFHDRAIAANVPAITTGGIYPGVSNGLASAILFCNTQFWYTSWCIHMICV